MTWVDYDKWNSVVASRLFGAERADLPVYIDVDNGLLDDCARELGLPVKDGRQALIAAVKTTLGLEIDSTSNVLVEHAERFQAWRRARSMAGGPRGKRQEADTEVPPIIALLAVLVLAAERMGADSNQAAHAYYPRLAEVLGLSEAEANRLRQRFPITEAFWRGLNEYLETQEGHLGLPTAYALGHRYVGIPQSQALVRAGDRAKLPNFFRQFALAPGSELIPADLERLLDAWIPGMPSPVSANLQRTWKGPAARERIAGVVAVELAHWDGVLRDQGSAAAQKGELSVTALVRKQFSGRTLELSLMARFPTVAETRAIRVLSADGEPLIGVVPAPGAGLRPAAGTRLDGPSLVGAILEIQNESTGELVSRRPRRVVPLRKDELLGAYIEVERVQLADDSILLVKDEPGLLTQVLGLLDSYGHHGDLYSSTAGTDRTPMTGVPEGWILVGDVQLFALPQDVKRLDLQVLVPLTTAKLSLAGGLKLPGRVRKWSSLQPPEVQAAVAEAEELRLDLSELGDERHLLESWTVSSPALVQPLAGLELADGDYELELFVNGENKAITASTLRLRSGDTPDVLTWETCTRLNHELDLDPLGALRAAPASGESEWLVDGLKAIGTSLSSAPNVPVSRGVSWSTKKTSRGAEAPVVFLGHVDPKSCIVTGGHYMEVEAKATNGRYLSKCRDCGVAKSYPARPRWKKNDQPSKAIPTFSFDSIPSRIEVALGWDECLDALIHVGGGNVSSLERVATQAEGSSLFIDDFLRTLELLGHIDVRRDDNVQPFEWEANPAYLAEIGAERCVLAGVWSAAVRKNLSRAVSRIGGTLDYLAQNHGPGIWTVSGVAVEELEQVVSDLDIAAYVVPNAIENMLAALPPLSHVEGALPIVKLPDYTKVSIFDLAGATWQPSPGVGAPGAYRLEQSFRRISVWVSPENALHRQAQVASVQLVKHLAARAAHRPLIGYAESSQTLVVPMGADLPGLYGRVAALCSGRSPLVSRATRSIGYPDVPRWVADRLNSLMLG